MRSGMIAAFAVAALAIAPESVGAQEWVTLPNGEYGVAFSYGTAAEFRCVMEATLAECSTAPDRITFTVPTGSMTLTFTGASGTATATTEAGTPVMLGTITPTFTGSGPYFLSAPGRSSWPVFHMAITGIGLGGGGYGGRAYIEGDGVTIGAAGANFVAHTMPRNPLAPSYRNVVILDGIPVLRVTEATTAPLAVSGWVGISPEPSTYVMLGTGLLALGGLALRRSRRG